MKCRDFKKMSSFIISMQKTIRKGQKRSQLDKSHGPQRDKRR